MKLIDTHGQGEETADVFYLFNLLHTEGFIMSFLLLLSFSADRHPTTKLLKAHRWAARTRWVFPERSVIQGGFARVCCGWPKLI